MIDQRWANHQIRRLDDAIRDAANSLGLQFVDIYDTPAGHELCGAPDVVHEVGPTFESFHIANAEAGAWTATLYGAQVAAQGEQTRLSTWQPPAANHDPVAKMSFTTAGRTITVDGGASTDSDGTVVDYLWEFGDGSTATGKRVSHTYTTPGNYLTTLAIRDNGGGEAFTSADHVVTIPKYEFSGFFDPVNAAPVVNAMKAGRAVPMKFALGGGFGLGVMSAGSPTSVQVSCSTGASTDDVEITTAAGGSSLSYDAATGTYTYVWKTATSWC